MICIKNDFHDPEKCESRGTDGISAMIRNIEQAKRALNVLKEHLENVQYIGNEYLDRKTVHVSLVTSNKKIRNTMNIAVSVLKAAEREADSQPQIIRIAS